MELCTVVMVADVQFSFLVLFFFCFGALQELFVLGGLKAEHQISFLILETPVKKTPHGPFTNCSEGFGHNSQSDKSFPQFKSKLIKRVSIYLLHLFI